MNDIRVSTWNELQEALFADSFQESIQRFRSKVAFRGMSRVEYHLVPSLTRIGRPSLERERAILRAFRKYAYEAEVPDNSIWNWLALAQHHGLPTRLFDWTYSPYVALHFVTEHDDRYQYDGVIWTVNYARTNAYLPERLKRILADADSDVFTSDLLCLSASTLEQFDAQSDTEFVAFFEPPSLDARIVNQYALFSLLSTPSGQLDVWLQQHPEVFRRIIIPAEMKWEIRDKLDQSNITERVLYPGLDGLTRWLKRYYRDRTWEPAGSGGTLPPSEEDLPLPGHH